MNSEIFVKKKFFCTFLLHISYCEQHRKLLDFLCKIIKFCDEIFALNDGDQKLLLSIHILCENIPKVENAQIG